MKSLDILRALRTPLWPSATTTAASRGHASPDDRVASADAADGGDDHARTWKPRSTAAGSLTARYPTMTPESSSPRTRRRHGEGAEPDAVCELDVEETAVLLELAQNCAIYGVHGERC
jgi:hypothetical protein